MTTDLLFSILPREGKVPIAHDEQKVQKVNKETALRAINEDDKPVSFNRRKAGSGKRRSAKRSGQMDRRSSDLKRGKRIEQKAKAPVGEKDTVVEQAEESKEQKGPKHLDLYV